MPSPIRPNPAKGPDVGMLLNRSISLSVMPCLGSQSSGQSFGSISKPLVPLYTPSIRPRSDDAAALPPVVAAGADPLALVVADGAAVVAEPAAVVAAPPAVVAAPAVVGAPDVELELSSLPQAASKNVAVMPMAAAAVQRRLFMVSPCSFLLEVKEPW